MQTEPAVSPSEEIEAINILHSITGLNIGGAEYLLARLLPNLKRAEISSTVLSLMTPGPLAARVSENVEIVSLGLPQGKLPLLKLPAVRAAFRTITADIVHGWMYHGNIAASAGRFIAAKKAPVIWSVHHSIYDIATEKPLTQKLIRLSAMLSRRTRAIIYCSRVAADQHEAIGFEAGRRVIIYNGVDCDEFKPDAGSKERLSNLLGLPARRLIVGSIGRFHPMKSQADLLRACASLIRAGHDIQCLFVGPGHEDSPLIGLAKELGIADRTSTLGQNTEIPSIMPGLDIHAISSAWGEAYSLATAEAMACGVPTVVTDVGDCAWVVGNTGLVVPRQDPEALAGALQKLIEAGSDGRRNIGRSARQRVSDKFSMTEYARNHTELYGGILQADK
ncbi:MAG: glycosyltransferase [Aestuariivirga sp.]